MFGRAVLLVWLSVVVGGQANTAVPHPESLEAIPETLKAVIENISQFGIEDGIEEKINETINSIAAALTGPIPFDYVQIHPEGPLDFGEINLELFNGSLTGLGDMVGEVVNFSVIPIAIKNVTIHFARIDLQAKKYTIDGKMLFPLGNQEIPLTGTGTMRAAITDLYISVNATFGLAAGGSATKKIAIKNLDIYGWAGNIELTFENFMNDDELSWAFNQVFSDVGITAFNFYKDAILQGLKEPLKELLNKLIQDLLP